MLLQAFQQITAQLLLKAELSLAKNIAATQARPLFDS